MAIQKKIDKSAKMGSEPIPKLLASMGLPAMLSMMVLALYNIVDSIFVANIEEKALTAVGFAFPLQLIMIAFIIGSGVGISSLISRQLGANKNEQAGDTASAGLRIALFNYSVFLIIGLFFVDDFIGYYTDDPVMFDYGTTYTKIVMCFSGFFAFDIVLQKILQATGNMVYPMLCSLTGVVVNLILDPILIFGLLGAPKMGIEGAAVATVTGQALAFALGVFLIITKEHEVKIKILHYKLKLKTIIDIYKVGLPSIIMQFIASLMILFINGIIAKEATAVAVLMIYFRVQSFIFMPVFGLVQGAMPIEGYNYGAGNKYRLLKTYKVALITACTITGLGMLPFQVLPDLILKMFNADSEMISIGVPALRTISLAFLPAACGIMTSTVFQATGHGGYSLTASILRQVVGIIPLAYVLYHWQGLSAMWFAFPIAEIIGLAFSVTMMSRLYIKKIKHLKPIACDNNVPGENI